MLSTTVVADLVRTISSPHEIREIFKKMILPNSTSVETAREGMAVIFNDVWNGDPSEHEKRRQVEIWQLVLREEFLKAADVKAILKKEELRKLLREVEFMLADSLAGVHENIDLLFTKTEEIKKGLEEIKELNKKLF